MNYPSLSFEELRKANVARCEDVFHPVNGWSPADWAVAFAGEAGEACDAVKKLKRHYDGTNTAKDRKTEEDCIHDIANELADTIIYADLLAARLGIDLTKAVRNKFNVVSIRMNSDIGL
jgi:NTP pyrophosphatase (non-canonical NTP hydrolase)